MSRSHPPRCRLGSACQCVECLWRATWQEHQEREEQRRAFERVFPIAGSEKYTLDEVSEALDAWLAEERLAR